MKKLLVQTEVACTIATGRLFCKLENLYDTLRECLEAQGRPPNVFTHELPKYILEFSESAKEALAGIDAVAFQNAISSIVSTGNRQDDISALKEVSKCKTFSGPLCGFPRYVELSIPPYSETDS